MFEITENKIILKEDETIGYIIYNTKDDYIVGSYIYVDPKFRGQGYSDQLMEKFVEFARSQNQKIFPVCPVIKRVLETKYSDMLVS